MNKKIIIIIIDDLIRNFKPPMVRMETIKLE